MKFLSLFDGCHMFGHALRNVGMTCIGTSEIEKHAANVTRYHYPETPQLGDVNHVDPTGLDFDCLLAGWSCQGNSVAGDRRGLDDHRSGLFSEIVRIAREGAPRWLLLENVPGMFSVNERRDFGSCIGALGELGYAVGWRVLDAQHFGVPQRRKRVFFVGCLGGPRSAAEVLFEPESVRGDSAPSREAGKGTSGDPRSGVAQCLTTGTEQRYDAEPETFICDLAQITSKTNRSRAEAGMPAPTLAKGGRVAAFNWRQDDFSPSDPAPTLDADGSGSVALAFRGRAGESVPEIGGSVANCLRTGGGGSSKPHALTPGGPRRLMPIECERLQGLPDDWTRYGRKPNGDVYELTDSPRYKMIGNGGAVPVVEWIGARMVSA